MIWKVSVRSKQCPDDLENVSRQSKKSSDDLEMCRGDLESFRTILKVSGYFRNEWDNLERVWMIQNCVCMIWKVSRRSGKFTDDLMHKILQNHLLCAFVANLKIDALYPESFCYKNLAIQKVFAFCDSASAFPKYSYATAGFESLLKSSIQKRFCSLWECLVCYHNHQNQNLQFCTL